MKHMEMVYNTIVRFFLVFNCPCLKFMKSFKFQHFDILKSIFHIMKSSSKEKHMYNTISLEQIVDNNQPHTF